jgi:hypothetical protein
MRDKRQVIPLAGLLATILFAAYMVVQLNGRANSPRTDFTDLAPAEASR